MTIREMPDAPCAICGNPAHAHTGSEMFCPIYATYRAAILGPFEVIDERHLSNSVARQRAAST